MSQLNLNFSDLPVPERHLWEQLDDKQKKLIVETLARLMSKAARAENRKEPAND